MDLSIIIPVYNEEKLVLQVLDALCSIKLPSFVSKMEIVVVDDCSKDNSFEALERYILASPYPIRLFRHPVNRGKGGAVKTGIEKAAGNVILIQDADLELSPSDIPTMLCAMHELKVGFINGSRYMPGVNRPLASLKRYLANKLFTLLTSVFVDVHLTDMACGYKLISKELLSKIQLREERFGIEAELIIKAIRIKRNNIAEVPVKYFPRNKGGGKKLRNIDGVKVLYTIFKYGLLKLK